MGYKNSKSKPLKDRNANKNVFFRAFLLSFVTAVLVWILLALVFAFVMSKMTDSSLAGKIFSPILCVVGLVSGGFVAGKIDKFDAVFLSVVIGCTFLAIGYGVSTAFDLSMKMGPVIKTLVMVMMLLCPVIGAKISMKQKRKSTRYKRKM